MIFDLVPLPLSLLFLPISLPITHETSARVPPHNQLLPKHNALYTNDKTYSALEEKKKIVRIIQQDVEAEATPWLL